MNEVAVFATTNEPALHEERRPAARPEARRSLITFVKHQLGGALAAIVDFTVMTLAVELVGISPVPATSVGALAGAVTSFMLGRRWIFYATSGSVSGQMVRYSLVSLGSLGLNSLGEYLFLRFTPLHYLLARFIVATAVGMGWNYSMHRWFVFRTTHEAPQDSAGQRSAHTAEPISPHD